MVNVVSTIIPIFAIIFLGCWVRRKGLIRPELLGPANRLVYYVAVPAMIFREVSGASLRTQFDAKILACTLMPVLVVFAISSAAASLSRIPRGRLGTFMQSAFHGNLGYIGLAVAYYFLGTEGFIRASIIAGFLMLLQNFLAVVALQSGSLRSLVRPNLRFMTSRVVGNPVILSALAGMALVIGASLSFELIRVHILSALGAGILKLIVLPAMGYFLYEWFGVAAQDYLPGLILLAAPTATLTYVMATEMRGDTELAIATISVSTMLSAITFSMWLGIAG
jgi:predicted permease